MTACLAALLLAAGNVLPADAMQALHSAPTVELYSLEPWFDEGAKEPMWHGYVLLGHVTLSAGKAKTAVAAIDAAIQSGEGHKSACVEPRQALHVASGGHAFDFLLSYDCHSLEVYRDDRKLASLAAGGSPKVLDKLLSEAKVPLSKSASD